MSVVLSLPAKPFPGSLRLQDCGLAQQRDFKVPILQSKMKQ